MKQEDKELLLRDLCARLPYGVNVEMVWKYSESDKHSGTLYYEFPHIDTLLNTFWDEKCISIKPYLRPMSSMTEEEKEELLNRLPKYWSIEIDKLGDLYFDICDASYPDIELLTDIIGWLNAHHFDYRGLIEKGLALEAPKDIYN